MWGQISQKRICLQCRRHRRHKFDPWVGTISWRRKWWPTPLPGEFLLNCLENSSSIAWRIPWTEEPGGLQSKWLQRVRHDWTTKRIDTIPFVRGWTMHSGKLSSIQGLYSLEAGSPFPFVWSKNVFRLSGVSRDFSWGEKWALFEKSVG